ncbi:hypothetical protein [Kineococcus sp. SYSU DK002]|uniref:hypothetical protein n=1 Tax=Kineococcus sp. SYSU DK002 TaxID=3383123 RepID=UPI003D7D01B9
MLLSGCSLESKSCSTAGGASGVLFEASALPTTAPLPWQATFCADDVCHDGVVDDYDSIWFDAENDQLGTDPVTAHLKVVAADGAVLADSTTELTTSRHDVNGNGCGPIVWRAGAVVGADGTLTAAPTGEQP